MKKEQLLISGIIVFLVISAFSGCIQQEDENGTSDQTGDESSFALNFVRKIEVADGYFASIVFANDQFYISYESNYHVYVKGYDKNFTATGENYQLISDEGVDHQMVFGNNSFYLANSFNLRKFDSTWNELAVVPFFEGLPAEVRAGWTDEGGIDDMLLRFANDSVYLGIAVGNMSKDTEKKLDTPDNLYVQQYNHNLELQRAVMLQNVGHAVGSSITFHNERFIIVCADKKFDDSSLIMMEYDEAGNFLSGKTISTVTDVNEEFAMGFLIENSRYFVGYHYITGDLAQPMEGKHLCHTDVMLKVFDINWTLLDEQKVTDDISIDILTNVAGRPHLAVRDDTLYVAYDSDEADSIKVFVKIYEFVMS